MSTSGVPSAASTVERKPMARRSDRHFSTEAIKCFIFLTLMWVPLSL